MDYQNDVRLAVRDELPTEINAEDMSESVYQQLFQTELVWPPLFFSGWAAFEPDVSTTAFQREIEADHVFHRSLAHPSLPMGEGSSLPNVQRRARPEEISNRRGALHRLQAL